MSFELPDLDTATSAELQTQLVRRIPQFTSRWTDFNASDPGITLLQLLSWLGESLMYQANAIPEEAYQNYLRWVLGLPVSNAPWPYAQVAKTQFDTAFLDLQDMLTRIEQGRRPSPEEMQAAVLTFLDTPYAAVTLADAEALAMQTNRMIDAKQAQTPAPTPPARVARADAVVAGEATTVHILPDTPLAYTRPAPGNPKDPDAAGFRHALLMIQPDADPKAPAKLAALLTAVNTYMAPRVLLGSAVRVAAATRTDINVSARLLCPAGVQTAVVLEAAMAVLFDYFQPITGGPRGDGWRYGEAPDPQAVRHLITGVPGVAEISSFALTYVPTIRLPDMARLGATTLLADLPPGPPAMIYAGLPRLRSIDLSAGREGS